MYSLLFVLQTRHGTVLLSPRAQLGPCRAQTVMTIVDTIVSRTNTQVADSAKVLQAILAAAANERGEWDLPLSAEKVLLQNPRLGNS